MEAGRLDLEVIRYRYKTFQFSSHFLYLYLLHLVLFGKSKLQTAMDITSAGQIKGNYLEKSKTDVSVSQPIEIDGIGPIVQDWTEEEERKVKRKLVEHNNSYRMGC